VLGISVLSPEGGEVATTVQMAMQHGVTSAFFRDTIFSHPSMSEALNDLFAKLV
jgi:pyruvate/2-oxoglutarate dehydrogenase complex dihydrolipoamide dehydrogenase (E3) component